MTHTAQMQRSLDAAFTNLPVLLPMVGIGVAIVLFAAALLAVWLVKRRVIKFGLQLANRDSALTNLAAELEAQALLTRQMSMDLEELRKRLANHEDATPPVSVWSSLDTPVNLNRRGQILRLSRKGKSVAEIARDLNIAQGEVDLLLKVHDLNQKERTE